jgi:hypothetical protein
MIGSSSFGPPFSRSSLKAARGDLERQHRGVDVVEGAVHQGGLEVDHREAGQEAVVLGGLQTLLDAGDVLLRHRAADDRALEDEARPGLARLGHQLHAGELARAAGLLLVRVVDLGALADRLAVGHLRRADVQTDPLLVDKYAELPFEMELV